IKRRKGRPRGRIKYRSFFRVEPQLSQHVVSFERTIDQAVELWHAHESSRGTVSVDGACVDEVSKTPTVDKKEAIPFPHRPIRPVVHISILSADAMKHLNSTCAPRKLSPKQICRKVSIELHQTRACRSDDLHAGRLSEHLAR